MSDWQIGLAVALGVGYLLTWLLLPWVLLKKTVNPSAAIAWMMGIVFLPYLGALLVLVFGVNRVARHKEEKRAASQRIRQRLPDHALSGAQARRELTPLQQKLRHAAETLDCPPPVEGNELRLMPDTKEAFDRLEQILLDARQSLHVEFYMWHSDQIGTRLRDLLIRKAQEGVTVRFLYDGIGSIRLGRGFLRPLRKAGAQVSPFLPSRDFRERWSINLRNHRKLIVADGRVGFTGGMNVGDEYLGRNPKYGFWRDTQLTLRGPAVWQMQRVFAQDWHYATGEEIISADLFPEPQADGDVLAHIIAGGPDQNIEMFHSLMFAAVTEAEETISLATAYFVPPQSLSVALEMAARTGVRVRLLVAKEATYLWTLLAGRSYYDSLLRAGVEIYEYEKGLFHGKTLTVDGQWSLVGTPNFDMRSLTINFEVAAALFDDRIAAQLEDQFEKDIRNAVRIDPDQWSRRSTWHRLGERFARLFAPIL